MLYCSLFAAVRVALKRWRWIQAAELRPLSRVQANTLMQHTTRSAGSSVLIQVSPRNSSSALGLLTTGVGSVLIVEFRFLCARLMLLTQRVRSSTPGNVHKSQRQRDTLLLANLLRFCGNLKGFEQYPVYLSHVHRKPYHQAAIRNMEMVLPTATLMS